MKRIEKLEAVEVRRALGERAAHTSELSVDERWAACSPRDRQGWWASLVNEPRGVCACGCTRRHEERRGEYWASRAIRPDFVLHDDDLLAWESVEEAEKGGATHDAGAVAGCLRHAIERLEADA